MKRNKKLLIIDTYKFGKWYLGTWSPAKPALITPEPLKSKKNFFLFTLS